MRIGNSPLTASVAASLLAAAGAVNATAVGTAGVSDSFYILPYPAAPHLLAELSGSGSGVLDNSGTFTATLNDSGTFGDPSVPGEPLTPVSVTETETFTGTYSGGTFTATGGTVAFTNCITGASGDCGLLTGGTLDASGSLTLSGGSFNVLGLLGEPYPDFQAIYDGYSVGPISAVPLPPAVWLFGSGLLIMRIRGRRGGRAYGLFRWGPDRD